MEPMKATSVNSRAEELFVQLFCEAFGPEKTENLQVRTPAWTSMGGTVISILRWNLLNPKLQSRLTVRPTTTLARCPKTNTLMTS